MIFTSSRPIASDHTIEEIDGLSHVVGDPSGLRFTPRSMVTIHSWGSTPFSSMEYMFENCNVTLCRESPVFARGCTLRRMFFGCSNFNEDLSRWDTENVTNMDDMFYSCSNFNRGIFQNTSNVTIMRRLFFGCRSFNQDISRWDTSSVTIMNGMFMWCESFNQRLFWNTSKVTTMGCMFFGCRSLAKSSLFDSSSVTDMNHMFFRCASLAKSPRPDTSKVTTMMNMFSECEPIAICHYDRSSVVDN